MRAVDAMDSVAALHLPRPHQWFVVVHRYARFRQVDAVRASVGRQEDLDIWVVAKSVLRLQALFVCTPVDNVRNAPLIEELGQDWLNVIGQLREHHSLLSAMLFKDDFAERLNLRVMLVGQRLLEAL